MTRIRVPLTGISRSNLLAQCLLKGFSLLAVDGWVLNVVENVVLCHSRNTVNPG